MSRSYACVILPDVKRNCDALLAVAHQFSYSIEMLDDGILFDVSGLERLIGKPERVAHRILEALKQNGLSGSVAVAAAVDTAILLARQKVETGVVVHMPDAFPRLPLSDLAIEQGTLNVFNDLGLRNVEDLLAIPKDELTARYGCDFDSVISQIEQKGERLLTPNVKENHVSWSCDLDLAIEDFEQLIFILNHGLDNLFVQIGHYGLSTEHLDISFKLANKTVRKYEIKTSFPTLERPFWLKLINLRASLDPPGAAIAGVNVIAYFTRPRPNQRGLYAVSRPEPENLLLTMNKLKKLVGEENVGVPVLLNQRLERPFALNADVLPLGKERVEVRTPNSIIAFNYFRPPMPVEVLVRDRCLVFIKSHQFTGHVLKYSGVWKANSKWWDTTWKTQEWDVEIENGGVYRLCKVGSEWFLAGEYD